MATQIQFKRGTAADLTALNTLLASGEPGYETDTGKFKIGDGTTAWNSLAYAAALPAHAHAMSDVTNLQTSLDAKLGDAPVNGALYGRKNGAWTVVDGGGSGATPSGDAFHPFLLGGM